MAGSFVSRLRLKLSTGHAPVCVGLDPRLDALPSRLLADSTPAKRIAAFYGELLPAIAPHVPVVKPNIAFFECHGASGFAAYEEVCKTARARGLLVIGDIKRGDIGSTASAYADVHLDLADAVTLHPLLGQDSIAPFLQRCAVTGGAVFVLVRTSNASATELQAVRTLQGDELSDVIAAHVHRWGEGLGDADDYGPVGAVVGATYPQDLARLRRLMPRALILVPGVGAQGGSVRDTLSAFDSSGMGGIISQSRGVAQCFAPDDPQWLDRVVAAAKSFSLEMRSVLRQQGAAS